MPAGNGKVRIGLVCLVTTVLLVTNAGSAPHPLETGSKGAEEKQNLP